MAYAENKGIRSARLSEVSNPVGQRIRSLRNQQGKSLGGLARDAVVSAGHLSQIEHGVKEPGQKVLVKLANALGVSVSYLVAESRTLSPNMSPQLEKLGRALQDPHIPEPQRKTLENLLGQLALLAEALIDTSRLEADERGTGNADAGEDEASDLEGTRQSGPLDDFFGRMVSTRD